jgi:hypothetical protein
VNQALTPKQEAFAAISTRIFSSAYVLPTAHHLELQPFERHHNFIVVQPIRHSQLDATGIAERSSVIAIRYSNPIICFS